MILQLGSIILQNYENIFIKFAEKKYKTMKHIIARFIFILIAFNFVGAFADAAVRYHCPEDSVRALDLIAAAQKGETYAQRVVSAARALTGIPAGPAADNDMAGTIVLRLDTLNQREFINMALAAAKASMHSNPGLREFEEALEEVSRKKGKDTGFDSQFLYGSDWIVDNVYRGNIKEMTDYIDGGSFRTKTLDYVSRHKDEFPALADSAVFEKIKVMEMGYRSHRIPHQKKQSINSKAIKEMVEEGDIIVMLIPDSDFDVYDIGIVAENNGQHHLIHLSKAEGKIVEDPYPLSRLFKIEGQFFYGYRWLRPQE